MAQELPLSTMVPTTEPKIEVIGPNARPLPPGRYALHFRLETAAGPARLTLAGKTADVAPGAPASFDAEIDHPGGPLTLSAATDGGTVWITEAALKNVH